MRTASLQLVKEFLQGDHDVLDTPRNNDSEENARKLLLLVVDEENPGDYKPLYTLFRGSTRWTGNAISVVNVW